MPGKMITTLIVGASGLLGRYLLRTASKSHRVIGTCFGNPSTSLLSMDIRDPSQVLETLYRLRPDIVINTAAIGSVDYVEQHPRDGYDVNVGGVRNLLDAVRIIGSHFVHISSNAVFSGDDPPYDEYAELDPINTYGIQKALADEFVFNADGPFLIIRPILMYGWPELGRQNIVTMCLNALEEDRVFRAAEDVITQPLYASDCARAIWQLVSKWSKGVYHIGGETTTSIYQFCTGVASSFGKNVDLIEPVNIESLRLSPRPLNTTFVLDKLYNMGIKPCGAREGLVWMQKERG